ncbi:MAG: hypothetical protein ACFFDY_10445 [Candidatus Thorarchaeota archaeon]
MVSFKDMESSLYNEEKILWKKKAYTNELKELRFTLNISILTIVISLFSIILYFLTSTINFDFLLTLFILLTVVLISVIPLSLLFRIYNEYKKIAKKLKIELSNLRNYEEFFILTNRRWIQKSFYLAKIDDFKFNTDKIIKKNDIAFLDLDIINVIYISPQKKEKTYWINFFKEWDKNLEESIFQLYLEKSDYKQLLETLEKIFQITTIEKDIFKYGDSAFYCKKIE